MKTFLWKKLGAPVQKVSLEPCCFMFSVFCYLDILNCIKMQIFFSKKEKLLSIGLYLVGVQWAR